MAINFDKVNRSRTADRAPSSTGWGSAGVGTGAVPDAVDGVRGHMLSIYNYMCGGLVVSGLAAILTFSLLPPATAMMMGLVASFAALGMLLIAAWTPLGRGMSVGAMQVFYWTFVVLEGIALAYLGYVYAGTDIVRALFITAAAFAGLSLYGYTTKQDLSGFGSFLIMGLIGLVIASVVNLFMQSSMMHLVISAAGVLIFSGLVAWRTQTLKEEYLEGVGAHGEVAKAHAIWGALGLYLDFINLFRFILALTSSRD